MKCPYCQNSKTRVIDSRAIDDGAGIRRRRHCASCGSRFTTFERREKVGVMVVKQDGAREAYDRAKLASGMFKACNKLNIDPEIIENNLDEIEEEILKRREPEISSAEVGDMVMERLRHIDKIAYLRFASVCKRFGDVSEFQRELGELLPGEADRTA